MNTTEAISACVANPDQLRSLEPSLFEAVIAELLAGFGWEVSLTGRSRDGGYDILGITKDRSGLQTAWIVQCKRYSAGNRVGVEVVRELLGVKIHLGVQNALLATTSNFTSDAQDLGSAHQDIHLVDFTKISEWLREYSPLPQSTHTAEQSFSSCFISHSSKDAKFAQKLAVRLRQQGIRVWYAPEDILPGEKIYDQVKKAISSFDRLLIILSQASMTSAWVQTELSSAIARERQERKRVLFPIALVSIETIKQWVCFDSDSGTDIARELRSYHIPDLSDWKNPVVFDKELSKITAALEESRTDGREDNRIFGLRQQMRVGTPEGRESAARALGELGEAAKSAVPTLRKALKDPSLYVRNAAAWALDKIATPEAVRALEEYESK
jgi:hypothetical protein